MCEMLIGCLIHSVVTIVLITGVLIYVSVAPVNLLENVSVALRMHMILWGLSLIRLVQH